jgi:hypothetical protein
VAASQPLLADNRILPVEVLRKALDIGSYGTVLFVLGHSVADVPVLKALMQTRMGCRSRRIAYLHDGDLDALVEAFLEQPLSMAAGAASQDRAPWMCGTNEPVSAAGRSLRFLVETGALDGVFVASHDRRDALRTALGSDAKNWTIDVATPETLGATLCGMPRALATVSRG